MFYDVYATKIYKNSIVQSTIYYRIGVLPVLQDSDASLHSHRDHPHRGSSPLKWKGCKQGSLARDWSIKRLAACNMFFFGYLTMEIPDMIFLFLCRILFFVDHCSNLSCRLKWDVWEQNIFERPESARLCCALVFFVISQPHEAPAAAPSQDGRVGVLKPWWTLAEFSKVNGCFGELLQMIQVRPFLSETKVELLEKKYVAENVRSWMLHDVAESLRKPCWNLQDLKGLGFPLPEEAGPYLCTQGVGGHLTHFFPEPWRGWGKWLYHQFNGSKMVNIHNIHILRDYI